MKKYIYLFVSAFAVAAAFTLSGCEDDECPVCPPEPEPEKDYHLVFSWVGPPEQPRALKYSTKTGDLVGEFRYSTALPFMDLRFSSDGSLAFYTIESLTHDATWITNWPRGDTIAISYGFYGQWLSLSGDERYILLSSSVSVEVLQVPNLDLVYQRSHPTDSWDWGAIDPRRNIAYVPQAFEDSLLVIDFRGRPVVDRKIPLRSKDGTPMSSLTVEFSLDGRYLMLRLFQYPAGYMRRFQIRDAETLEILSEHGIYGTKIFRHPDGNRIFFLERYSFVRGTLPEVWVLDLSTQLTQKVIDCLDIAPAYGWNFFDPNDMDFTPDGRYAFILGGGGLDELPGGGVIFKVDCATYEVLDAIYPPQGSPSETIRINPIEIRGGAQNAQTYPIISDHLRLRDEFGD